MRRVVCREFGPPERLVVEEAPDPQPGPGEVLIGVRAAGVAFVDGLIVTVIGVDWGAWAGQDPAGNRALIADLFGRVAAGVLRPVAPRTYPLEQAAEALSDLGGRRVTGKLALLP